jgi:hypothetical protein
MITWKLWRQIRLFVSPHPYMRRILTERRHMTAIPLFPGLQLFCGLALCISMLSPVGVIFVGLVFLLVTNSTAYTLVWVSGISGRLAHIHTTGQYDVMCATPQGKLGLHWAVCTGVVHRNDCLDQVNTLISVLIIIIGAMIVIPLLVSFSVAAWEPTRTATLLLTVGVLLAAIYLDHVQSIVCGCVVGMLVPFYVHRTLDARFAAAGLFLLVQVVGYLAAIGLAFEGVNALFTSPDQVGLVSVTRLLVFAGIREALIYLLWHWLRHASDAALSRLPRNAGVIP